MQLNGFEIEKYNIYGINENARTWTCPECSADRKKKTEKCMSVFWDTGLGQCNHCGARVQLHTYKKKETVKEYVKPKWTNNTKLSDKVVKFFEERGISQFVLRQSKVTSGLEYMPQFQKEVETIQFNYFRNGELINVKYRGAQKSFKLFKDAERILYNLDACHISKEIIIVEGEIDALSYMEAGKFNVVSIPNGATLNGVNLEYVDNSIEYFENKDKIYLALDNDDAGRNVSKELARRFGNEKCLLVDFKDTKDANEYLIKYGKEGLKNTIEYAKEIPIEGVSSLYDWKDDFEDYLLNGMQQGYISKIDSFNKIFSTYTGQFITITGIPSSGKSDFVDQLCVDYNNIYGWKIAYASPENKPNKIHAGKIISKLSGEWINKREQIHTDWYKKTIDKINSDFKFIDLNEKGYDLESVLEKTKSLIFKFGIKVLVIDPYNKVRLKSSLNKNITEYTNDYLAMIDEFARKYDILIFVVAHPRKPNTGESLNYEPTFYDIKGGGEFYDMSPHGILVHRDYARDIVKIKVLKVKFSHLGENNKSIYLKWNSTNGRYSDFSYQSEMPEELSGIKIDNDNWIINKENNIQQEHIYLEEDCPF